MKNKTFLKIVIGILLLILIIYLYSYLKNIGLGKDTNNFGEEKLKVCPEAWYENRMPTIDGNGSYPQYLIVNGTRRNVSEFDIAWVIENCEVNKSTPVY